MYSHLRVQAGKDPQTALGWGSRGQAGQCPAAWAHPTSLPRARHWGTRHPLLLQRYFCFLFIHCFLSPVVLPFSLQQTELQTCSQGYSFPSGFLPPCSAQGQHRISIALERPFPTCKRKKQLKCLIAALFCVL